MTARMAIRWHGRDALIEESAFESLVRAGLIPEDAWIISPAYTQGHAIQAIDLEVYHLWRPEPPRPAPRPSILTQLYLRQRLSLTIVLIAANLIVAGALRVHWRGGYPYSLDAWARDLKPVVSGWWDLPPLLATTFVHADARHLFGNLLYLFAFGSAVEYVLGAWRTAVVYAVSGWAGAALSFAILSADRVTVGASGAIFGLIGATGFYLVRHLREFEDALRWRARRVFIPLVLAAIGYSLMAGNAWAHLGGLVAGILVAVVFDRPLPGPVDAGAGSGREISDRGRSAIGGDQR